MRNILLSADNEISVFSVPDEVADNLEEYCLEFAVIGYTKVQKQQSIELKWVE